MGEVRLKGAERQMECHEPPQRTQSIRKIVSMPDPQFLLSPKPLTRQPGSVVPSSSMQRSALHVLVSDMTRHKGRP